MRALALALLATILVPFVQEPVDPALHAAVERFYAAQQAEDAAAYLSLWASTAQRPKPEQLKFIFDSGDDQFSNLTILRVSAIGDRTVVRASVVRDRTSATARRPDGLPMTFHTVMNVALTYVREGGEWKLVREGGAVDSLADALIAAAGPDERETLMAAEPDLSSPLLVSAVSRQADAFAQSRDYARAQTLYELALELATRFQQPKLQAETLQNIGNAMYYQRDFPGALASYRKRLAVERTLANDEGIANALVGIGTVQYSQFEYTDALVAYREALAIHEQRDDTPAIATTLLGTGNIQFVEGDFAGAVADYTRSRALFLQGLDKRGETRALEALGRSFAAQGDFAGALVAYSAVLEEGRAENNRAMQGNALSSMGDVHFRIGNLDTARGLFDRSRTHFEAMNDLPAVGRMWQAIALADLAASRFAAAEQEYTRSRTACTTAGDPECTARAIVGLAFAQTAQEHYEPAIVSYRQAIAAFTSLKKREDAARAELGLSQALAGAHDYKGAIVAAVHAHSEGTAMGRDDVVWRALVAQARALRRTPDPASALTTAAGAAAVVDRMAQAALERPNEPLAADTADAYGLLAVLQAEAGDATGAFATVEKRRAHALRSALARNERDIARGMTAAEREEERQLAASVVTIGTQVEHMKGLPKPDGPRLERLQQELATVVDKRRASRHKLFARLPDLLVWRGLGPPATLDEAAGALRGVGEVLAEFVIDDEDLLIVILTRRAEDNECLTFLTPIRRGVLALRIAQAVERQVLRSVDEWRTASAEFMKAIPTPAWNAIAAAPAVVLVPDDVLWRVPFEALPVETGVLADRTTVVYAGSATSLVRVPPSAPPAEKEAVVVAASPELPGSTRDRIAATSPGWTLPAADAAAAEVHAIGGVFDEGVVTALSGGAATEASVRARAGGASLIHVAAPFKMNGASPLFSPVLLSNDPSATDVQPDNDGVLELREVVNLDLHARGVILSDGGSMSMRGAAAAAEIVRWAWRAAGVTSTVLARWAMDPGDSVAVLKEMYAHLKDGDAPEVALQRARASVRIAAGTRAPYFWAGWMTIGISEGSRQTASRGAGRRSPVPSRYP
jgi:tetratricopeptide (TPR) repeat protein/CHAT domain-containing protein